MAISVHGPSLSSPKALITPSVSLAPPFPQTASVLNRSEVGRRLASKVSPVSPKKLAITVHGRATSPRKREFDFAAAATARQDNQSNPRRSSQHPMNLGERRRTSECALM